MSETIVLASGNPHKRGELAVAFAPLDIEVTVLDDPPHVEETGDTFAANALLKALGWYNACGKPSLADDSGLEVDALGGEPGVYSARYAGIDGSEADAANNLKLLQELGAETDRSARFRCALALVAPRDSGIGRLLSRPLPNDVVELDTGRDDLVAVCCTGTAEGTILAGPRGDGGFGYDPLFLSEDLGKTFAEAASEEKAQVSHRAKAVSRLKAVLSRS